MPLKKTIFKNFKAFSRIEPTKLVVIMSLFGTKLSLLFIRHVPENTCENKPKEVSRKRHTPTLVCACEFAETSSQYLEVLILRGFQWPPLVGNTCASNIAGCRRHPLTFTSILACFRVLTTLQSAYTNVPIEWAAEFDFWMWGSFFASRFIACAEENNAQDAACVLHKMWVRSVRMLFFEIQNRVERIWTIVAQ